MPENQTTRLNKYLAHTLGISRREADLRISSGQVQVNGEVAELGQTINPNFDKVSVDTIDVAFKPNNYTYVLFNKPVGYVCSRNKQGDAPTIYSLLPNKFMKLKTAGRLDKDSCGLLLLTDDGDTIFQMTHPKFAKKKTYQVLLNKPLKNTDLENLKTGVQLEDGVSKLLVKSSDDVTKPNMYIVSMFEGRNRQIRRTFKQLGYSVTHLERTAMGPYNLKQLGTELYLQIT